MNKTQVLRRGAALLTMIVTFFFGATLMADTLELSDGTILEGDFVGSSNGVIMFNTGDGIEAYPEDQVAGVFFSSGAENAAAQASAPQAPALTVPVGTRLVIRTVEDVDTRRHGAGHRFRGQLENAITVDGVTVTASVIGPKMDKKLYVQKFRRRKNSSRRIGHRQKYLQVIIDAIEVYQSFFSPRQSKARFQQPGFFCANLTEMHVFDVKKSGFVPF